MRVFQLFLVGLLGLVILLVVGGCRTSRASSSARAPASGRGGSGAPDALPPLVIAEPALLKAERTTAQGGLRAGGALHDALRAQADAALQAGPFTVVKKTILPDSGDVHDYMSLGRYWWPNPNTPNGLPYVWKDGEVNPEINSVPDKQQVTGLIASVTTLAHAYYLFENREYARKAAQLLRTFFLDPSSRMNPNMDFAQIHRGAKEVRGSGLIDARDFFYLPAAIQLLAPSGQLSDDEIRGLQSWFSKFYTWLKTGVRGKDEAQADNNHGTFFMTLLTGLGSYAGETGDVNAYLTRKAPKLLVAQIRPDGSQPRELKRTKPLSYSIFNLIGWSRLAALAKGQGVDLWHYEASDGSGSLQRAFGYLVPCFQKDPACTIPPSPLEHSIAERGKDFAMPLYRASQAYNRPEWAELAATLAGGETALKTMLLMPPGSK